MSVPVSIQTASPMKMAGPMKMASLTLIGTVMPAQAAMADYRLTILHTNDFHARFEPISKYDSGCSAAQNDDGKCFGRSARLVSAIAAARARAANSILVDGGDQFQGSLFYTYYKGKVAAEMMNEMRYDAMTVGNHEFDDGPETLRGFIDTVNFPVLMSNADITREPTLADKLTKSVIIERDGAKLGLIGVTPIDTHELASPGPNITFIDPVPAVQREVDKMRAVGVNKIILLSHSGFTEDQRIAAETDGVDVIVGGHSNTYLSNVSDRAAGAYPTMVGDTAIVQAYAYGKVLGELNVVFDDDGYIRSASGEPLIMDAAVAEDTAIKARITELGAPLEEIRQTVVASAAAVIEGNRAICRVQECTMGNLVAEAVLAKVADQGVQIAIMNSGGIRASIDAGDVTMGKIYTVLPFQNTLSTFKVSGATLIAALENGVSQIEDVKGRFPQIAGMKFTFDRTAAPSEGQITSVMVRNAFNGWDPVNLTASYYMVSNNYVRNGGDGYKMFRDAEDVYDFGPDLAEVVTEYMAAHAPVTPSPMAVLVSNKGSITSRVIPGTQPGTQASTHPGTGE